MTFSEFARDFWDTSGYPPASALDLPERILDKEGILEKSANRLFGNVARNVRRWFPSAAHVVRLAQSHANAMHRLTAHEMPSAVYDLRKTLHQQGMTSDTVARAFALIREIAGRKIGLRHYDVQLEGAWAILNGMIAEMETGEGKTLTATLAAGTAALAGIPVHVISVNDYLTRRDSDSMRPVYAALGLKVGCVTQEASTAEKQHAYQCDITYATNKVIVFDYLRDRIALRSKAKPLLVHADMLCNGPTTTSELLQRGLFFGIIDEADSVLVDEARTPLIISGSSDNEDENLFLYQAVELADGLARDMDYTVDFTKRVVKLTDQGKTNLKRQSAALGPIWTGRIRREDIVEKALIAKYLFIRDEHYIVDDGNVQIVDEFTGRVMPDRSWEHGLHQLIEIREECDITGRRETIARISYQNFFRRYLRLGGMTGTAREIQKELYTTYGLCVRRIPTNRPVIRMYKKDRIFRTVEDKWDAVVVCIDVLYQKGQPVLVGTRSVAASEHLSRLLTEKTGIPHQVLNAWKIAEEAEIVARAGQAGTVTIATNMAGRGTDIKLEKGVKEKGGLHVLLTERHEASRIDRQLAGRCGRQGDPGCFEAFLSIEDPISFHEKGMAKSLSSFFAKYGLPGWRWLGRYGIDRCQKKIEARHRKIRRQLFQMDEKTEDLLKFAGQSD